MIVEDLLRCSTSRGEFAVRSGDVRHVARAEHLRADDCADGRIGALKLGHQLVPVFSLADALGLGAVTTTLQGDQHVAVTGDGSELVGWLVDKLSREPAAGVRIAPMPASIGGRARRWFEAVITCANGDTALLIDPRELNPFAAHSASPERHDAAIAPAAHTHSAPAEPVALIFSTAAFPASSVDKFALSGREVAAIVQPTPAISVPGSAAQVSGLTMWRDVVVPIVDYREGVRTHSPYGRRMIARCGARAQSLIAFPIDDDVMMHRPAADDRPIANAECPPYASGVFDIKGRRVALLNVDALVQFSAQVTHST